MPPWIIGAGAVLGLIAAIFALDRVACWMEARGWIYWRHKKGSASAMGNVFAVLNEAFDPSVKHTQSIHHKHHEDDEGDPLDDDELMDPLRYKEEKPRRHSGE